MTIVSGTIPHIVFNGNRAINFALDKYGSNGWDVDVHHTSGGGYVEVGVVGSTVNAATFQSDLHEVVGTGDVFSFVFHWWPSEGSGLTVHYYGWVSLGTSNGDLVVLASKVADEPDTVLVGRGEPVDWWDDLYHYSETLPDLPMPLGTIIHIDDKLWLRYFVTENGGTPTTNWQACVGMLDVSSNVVERVVDLKATDEGAVLPSPVGAWTTVRIDAENTASPHGLCFCIWIGGVAAASTDDATIFYARPSAADRSSVAALGLMGNTYLDDLMFFKKHRNPLDGVDINTWHQTAYSRFISQSGSRRATSHCFSKFSSRSTPMIKGKGKVVNQ